MSHATKPAGCHDLAVATFVAPLMVPIAACATLILGSSALPFLNAHENESLLGMITWLGWSVSLVVLLGLAAITYSTMAVIALPLYVLLSRRLPMTGQRTMILGLAIGAAFGVLPFLILRGPSFQTSSVWLGKAVLSIMCVIGAVWSASVFFSIVNEHHDNAWPKQRRSGIRLAAIAAALGLVIVVTTSLALPFVYKTLDHDLSVSDSTISIFNIIVIGILSASALMTVVLPAYLLARSGLTRFRMATVGLFTGMSIAAVPWLIEGKWLLSDENRSLTAWSFVPIGIIAAVWSAGVLFAVFDMHEPVADAVSGRPPQKRRATCSAFRAIGIAACVSIVIALVMTTVVPALLTIWTSHPHYAAIYDAGLDSSDTDKECIADALRYQHVETAQGFLSGCLGKIEDSSICATVPLSWDSKIVDQWARKDCQRRNRTADELCIAVMSDVATACRPLLLPPRPPDLNRTGDYYWAAQEQECVDLAVERMKARGAGVDGAIDRKFLRDCFGVAARSEDLCRDVPLTPEIRKQKPWSRKACKDVDLPDSPQCIELMLVVAEQCQSPER